MSCINQNIYSNNENSASIVPCNSKAGIFFIDSSTKQSLEKTNSLRVSQNAISIQSNAKSFIIISNVQTTLGDSPKHMLNFKIPSKFDSSNYKSIVSRKLQIQKDKGLKPHNSLLYLQPNTSCQQNVVLNSSSDANISSRLKKKSNIVQQTLIPQVSKSCSLTNFVERKFKKIVSQSKNSNEESKRPVSFNFSKSQNYSNPNRVDYEVQKIYQCHFCFVRFEAKEDLLLHLEVHKGKRIFTCSICSKSFLQKSDLIRHIQIHSGERNFVCELCKATFVQKSTLRTHMFIHTREKSFSCNFCEKKFSRKYYMSQHLKVHYNDKPFPCSLCNLKYKHRSTLMTHMRIHLGTKCFGCRNCKKSYNSLKSLSTHISSNHSEAESFCTLCNLTLDQKELNLHIKRHILEKLKKINSLKEIEKESSMNSSEDQIQNFYNDNYLPTNFIDVNNSKKELNSAYEVICSDNKDDLRVLIKDFPLNETEAFPDDKQLIDPLLLSEI